MTPGRRSLEAKPAGVYRRSCSGPCGPGTVWAVMAPTVSGTPEKLNSCATAPRRSSTVWLSALTGFIAARVSRKRFARGSRGIISFSGRADSAAATRRSQRQGAPRGSRPLGELHPVIGEQRHRQPVHAERHAAGVRRLVAAVLHAPHVAEMLAMVIEAHAGGRPGAGVIGNEQLEH